MFRAKLQMRILSFAAVFGLLTVSLFASAAQRTGENRKGAGRHRAANAAAAATPHTSRYKIELTLNFDARSYTGTEVLRWVNNDDHPANIVFFHLYSNLRLPPTKAPAPTDAVTPAAPPVQDEPHIEITEVRRPGGEGALQFALDDSETTLRVNLEQQVPAGGSTEIVIKFKGTVPEVDPEQTGLLAHVIQQVGAALRSEREARSARNLNFSCQGMTILGAAFPLLAAREGGDWQRKVEPTIGDVLFSDMASYDVQIRLPADVALFTSGRSIRERQFGGSVEHIIVAENLRNFAIVAARDLRVAERTIAGVQIRSAYSAEHEVVGLRVLNQSADAVRVFTARFGPLPLQTISVVETPMVAGLGSMEFSGLTTIASAFYVNFDSPQVKALPELIREQRTSVEDSLEWTVAHVIAHQWWGTSVGSDPQRYPVLDEALANYSALLYYKDVHSAQRADAALDDQLRGVYKVYRTFGGEDMSADRSAHDYRNFFQYSAIVASKGALMFAELRSLLGDVRFFSALKDYYKGNTLEVAEMDDLRGAFLAVAPATERRAVSRTFNRWLSSKRGDEDISPPDPRLAAELGVNPSPTKGNDHNAFTRLGKFFWQQMTRIR